MRRVKSDAHAGLAHAGAFASGTQWDRSTRRGPMASRTRSTTSARREGTRARGAARRGGVCSSGVPGRAGESSDASGGSGGGVDDVAASRGITPASWSATRPACAQIFATRDTPRVRGVATADVMLPGVGNASARGTLARVEVPPDARPTTSNRAPPSWFPSTQLSQRPRRKVKSRARHPPSRDFNEAVLATRRRDTKSERAEYAGRTPNVIEF